MICMEHTILNQFFEKVYTKKQTIFKLVIIYSHMY